MADTYSHNKGRNEECSDEREEFPVGQVSLFAGYVSRLELALLAALEVDGSPTEVALEEDIVLPIFILLDPASPFQDAA